MAGGVRGRFHDAGDGFLRDKRDRPPGEMNQCLFGEHRIPASTGPVCIVESEKTAMIASIYFPNATFVATGGFQNMQPEKMRCLMGREIILFPDLDATEHWKKKRDTIPCLHDAKVSTWLEENSTSEEKHRDCRTGAISLPFFSLENFSKNDNSWRAAGRILRSTKEFMGQYGRNWREIGEI